MSDLVSHPEMPLDMSETLLGNSYLQIALALGVQDFLYTLVAEATCIIS